MGIAVCAMLLSSTLLLCLIYATEGLIHQCKDAKYYGFSRDKLDKHSAVWANYAQCISPPGKTDADCVKRPFTCSAAKGEDGKQWPAQQGPISFKCKVDAPAPGEPLNCPPYHSKKGSGQNVVKVDPDPFSLICTYTKECPNLAMSDYEDYLMYEEALDNLEMARDTYRMAKRLWKAEMGELRRDG